jgi:hypothetical protein
MIGEVPLILRISEVFYPVLGYIMLFISRDKRNYSWYAFVFLIPYIIELFTGLRGGFVVMFLTVIFIYNYRYGFSNIRGILLKGIYVFLAMSIMEIYRFSGVDGVSDAVNSAPILSVIADALAFNGVSMAVISYTIQLQDEFFNSVPFLFGYIFAIFSFAPNYTYIGIQEKDYLAQHITYLLYPEKLYGGSTIGTAMGAEFYEISSGNFSIIFLLSILMLYIASYLVKNLYKNKLMFYIGAIYIQALIISPRGSVMKVFNKETLVILVVFAVMIFLSKLVKHMSKR